MLISFYQTPRHRTIIMIDPSVAILRSPPVRPPSDVPSTYTVVTFTEGGLTHERHDARERTFGSRQKPYDIRKDRKYVQLHTGEYYYLLAEHRIRMRTPAPQLQQVDLSAKSAYSGRPDGGWSWEKPHAIRWAETEARHRRKASALEREQ